MKLSLMDLTIVRDGRTIISKFSADFQDRSITLLTGPNGSGKSTLLGAIAGDLIPQSGSISLDQNSLIGLSSIEAAKVRAILQQRSDFSLGFRVEEILSAVIQHCQKDSATRSLKALAVELDLLHLLDRSVLELSGGERQRVSLAITLVRQVRLYLLDEPLSAQDASHCLSITRYLEKIAKSGSIFIIATHQNEDLAAVASGELTLAHT